MIGTSLHIPLVADHEFVINPNLLQTGTFDQLNDVLADAALRMVGGDRIVRIGIHTHADLVDDLGLDAVTTIMMYKLRFQN